MIIVMNSTTSHARLSHQEAVAAARPSSRRLMIEDLDTTAEQGTALLGICIVAAPAVNAPTAPIRFE
jgi:hypothetical protein